MSAYILPPINYEAINAQVTRFGITDAMLVSSSVPETPPAAYAAGTTYALNAECSTGTVGGVITVWRSLQAGNLAKTPGSNPTWWASLGTTYSLWAAGTSWATGARVIRTETHSIYERLAPGGVDAATPESDITKWVRVSATNRWAMFDMLSAAPTVAVSPLVVVLAPGRASGWALLESDGGTVEAAMTSGGTSVHYEITSLDATPLASWEDYFFADFQTRANVVRDNLPTYTDGQITITVNSGSSAVSAGWLIVGKVQDMGRVQAEPTIRRKTWNVVKRDKWGELEGITSTKSIPLVSQTFIVPKSQVLKCKTALDAARTTPCVIVGLSNSQDEYAELLTFLGICNDNTVTPKNQTVATISAELEGV